MCNAMANAGCRPPEKLLPGHMLRNRIHEDPSLGLRMDVARKFVDVYGDLAVGFILLLSLFRAWLRSEVGWLAGLLRRTKEKQHDEWDRDHRFLLGANIGRDAYQRVRIARERNNRSLAPCLASGLQGLEMPDHANADKIVMLAGLAGVG